MAERRASRLAARSRRFFEERNVDLRSGSKTVRFPAAVEDEAGRAEPVGYLLVIRRSLGLPVPPKNLEDGR